MAKLPGLMTQAKNLTIAAFKWIVAGRPMRSAKQIADLYEICKACPTKRFIPCNGVGRCTVCACWLRPEGLSKLAWKTEACPEGHWHSKMKPKPIDFDNLEDDD